MCHLENFIIPEVLFPYQSNENRMWVGFMRLGVEQITYSIAFITWSPARGKGAVTVSHYYYC